MQKGERGYPAGFYHRALHCSLTIFSSFTGRGNRRAGTSGRRKSCGTCRCSCRPCHRTWKTPITRQSLKRRLPLSLAVEKVKRWGRGKSSGANERPRHGENVLRDSTWRKGILAEESAVLFRERRGGWLFFFYSSLCPPASPSLSFSCFFPRRWAI